MKYLMIVFVMICLIILSVMIYLSIKLLRHANQTKISYKNPILKDVTPDLKNVQNKTDAPLDQHSPHQDDAQNK